jgi:hypothetical protein
MNNLVLVNKIFGIIGVWFLLVLAGVLFCPQAEAQTPRPLLQGGVDHVESMPAVEPALRAGATYDAAVVDKLTPGNDWFRIPSFLAGYWKTTNSTRFYVFYSSDSSEDRQVVQEYSAYEENFGHQVDKEGSIWHYTDVPYKTSIDKPKVKEIQIVSGFESMYMDPSKIILRHRSKRIQVDKVTQKITKSFQAECIQTYTQVDAQHFRMDASIQSYDQNGKPMNLTKRYSFATRVDPFKPVTFFSGKNIKQLFVEYLTYRGLAYLIPN